MSDPTRLSAAALAAAIAAGELSAEDAAAAHLERARALQDELNAFTQFEDEAALRAACGALPAGPLRGVPVAIKDLIDHAGRITTAGSSFYRHTATESAPVVARLEAAGAVVVGRTGLHEFAFGFSSENHWFGPVRNPWDATLSPGGSSGGSAVAVASGMVPVALGTDTGGSVRVPAALCGIVGLKVTHGRVPISGVFSLAASLDTVGVFARDAADAGLLYSVIAGDHPDDPWTAPQPVDPPGPPADLGALTVAVPHPWVDGPVEPGLNEAFAAALDAMAAAGARVAHVDAPELAPPWMLAESFSAEVAAVHRPWFADRRHEFGPDIAERIAAALEMTADDYVAGLRWRASIRHAMGRLHGDADVIATPAVAANRKTIGVDTIAIDGSDHSYRLLLSAFSAPVNHAGLPAIALPLAQAGEPPPSLQLIAGPWRETALLEIAAALEIAGIVSFRPPPCW